jgi:RimJ/RimL family protein N-acetyltransferase
LIVLNSSNDAEYIKSVFKHEAIWEWVSDDSCNKDEYEPFFHEAIHYLVPELDGQKTGVLMLVKCNAVTVELHTAVLPEFRGKCVGEMFTRLTEWAQDEGYSRIRTWVPECNKAAYVAASRVGFSHVGVEQKAFLKDGELYDLHLFGKTLCQQ